MPTGSPGAEWADVLAADILAGRRKWLAARATCCTVEDENRQFQLRARVVDNTCRSALMITDEASTREVLQIQRPRGNFRLETIHEGIPVTDDVYLVTDVTSGLQIGVVQKPWMKGVWHDLSIVRNADWSEVCRGTQSSRLRALVRTFLVPALPGRYRVDDSARCIGTYRTSWNLGRLTIRVDLRQDHQRALDRRLAIALLMLLLTR